MALLAACFASALLCAACTTAGAVVGRGGQAAPCGNRPSLAAGRERDSQPGPLARTRSQAAAVSGQPPQELAQVQRVRPRTLLTIAALSAAFYYLLPQLAKVAGGWRALGSAHWAWVLVVIAFSALTYLASAIGLLGGVSVRVPFWPTSLTQGASSFVHRVGSAMPAALRHGGLSHGRGGLWF